MWRSLTAASGRCLRLAAATARRSQPHALCAISAAAGVAVWYGQSRGSSSLPSSPDLVWCAPPPPPPAAASEPIGASPSKRASWTDNYRRHYDAVFGFLQEDYNDRGQLDLGEEHITVQPHVFAQIGILEPDGVERLFSPPHLNPSGLTGDDVFCDIGSGVGNVCLQVLMDSPCRKAVGVEIIPSRARSSERAFTNAVAVIPERMRDRRFDVLEKDLTLCADDLNRAGVTVVFTHSWMFDDDLMLKMSQMLSQVSSLRFVATSRPLDMAALSRSSSASHAGTEWHQRGVMHTTADWNPEAPFFVYERRRVGGG